MKTTNTMKRRQFLTTAALTAIGATLAPQILKGQDPYLEYARMEAELLNWYITPRTAKHVKSNNHWHLLQMGSEWGYGDVLKQWQDKHDKYLHGASSKPMKWSGRTIKPWDEGGVIRMYYAVPLRDYSNVYAYDGVGQSWMNVEDYVFYQHIMGMGEYSVGRNRLIGCGLVPGLIDPFNPIGPYYNRFYTPSLNPVDSYEIHVIWKKR